MNPLDEFKQTYFAESAELLADMEARLLMLEPGVQDRESLNAIFRCAHSIKGGAAAFGLDTVMEFTHILEALLEAMRSGTLSPSRKAIDLLLKAKDILATMLLAAREERALPLVYGSDIAGQLQAMIPADTTAPAPAATKPDSLDAASDALYHIHFRPHAELFLSANEPLRILRELRTLGEAELIADTSALPELSKMDPTHSYFGWTITLRSSAEEKTVHEVFEFVEHLSDLTISRELPTAVGTPADEPNHKPTATTSIRVDLDKVDRLVNMVGELVITEAMLRSQMRSLPADRFPEMARGIDELSHHTRELQEAVMAMRMQPVKSIFSRMPRVVRDTAAQLGKDIELHLSGENTEVDKTVIEQLADPLTHMIRNAVDHGIEAPEQRIAAGKPVQGRIGLSAFQRSGRIVIEVSDDGAGIDRSRVLAKAQEKGLVAANATPSPEEIDEMIFYPGFSTAAKVTSVSGRGVGMDVVRRNIEALGGTARISNRPGRGATFIVSLPLTLAILDGMIVRVGAEHYIVPITNILESLRPKRDEVCALQCRADVINVRGEFIPLLYLYRLFGVGSAVTDASQGMVVLVEVGAEKIGLVVDELVGQQQVVIKSLEANADPVKGISGATILGDGKVSLILEVNELAALVARAPQPQAA